MTGALRCAVPRPDAARVRLVCFPPAGASAAFYREWTAHLPATIELHAVQYPGRADRFAEPAVHDMGQLVDTLVPEIVGIADRPVALFGHSMGATVGFEVARTWERSGRGGPAWLFVSGQRAPQLPHDDDVHLRDDAGVVEELRRLGGTDPEVLANPDLMALLLPTIRADYTLIEQYRRRAGPPLTCPVSAFVGDSDTEVTPAEAAAWNEQTSGEFTLTTHEGGHFAIVEFRARIVARVVTALSDEGVTRR
jgi:pyochelin biosynthesis protein PchC